MRIENIVRLVAGAFVLLSVALSHWMGAVDLTQPSWLWFTLFVGANLFQSSLTGFCPLVSILKRLGVGDPGPEANPRVPGGA